MSGFSKLLDACDEVGRLARHLGVGLLQAEDHALNGRTLEVAGRTVRNFSSCSYLGLELDERLIEGAVQATRRFGTQFSMSRAFVSAPPYAELEALLEDITGGPSLVLPTTSLASQAVLPSVIESGDALLFDQQVHMSVQSVFPTLEKIGVAIEPVSHGRIDRLEQRIKKLEASHRRIWFACDGLFSMHGDFANLDELNWLQKRYASLHLYVDDAHGTSWFGRHGRGFALEGLRERDRVIVALSLNKSFAAGGAVLTFPNEALRDRVRHVSGPTNFSGPLQPPMLGAAIASARLHLSDALAPMQQELRQNIEFANHRAGELGLPLLHRDTVGPIRFIGLGPQVASVDMVQHLLDRGFLPSCALFPAVPGDQTGIRLTVTRHQEIDDLNDLLETMADYLPLALKAGGIDREELDRRFAIKSEASS